jgi:hypothetical protein
MQEKSDPATVGWGERSDAHHRDASGVEDIERSKDASRVALKVGR